MKVLYFTGTGNSLFVAKSVSEELLSIPQLIKDNQYIIEDESVGIVIPTYGANIPKIVREYIDKVTITCKYCFVIMTCSDDNSGAVNYLAKRLSKRGIKVNYSNIIYMYSNHIPFINLEDDLKIEKNIDQQISLIKEDVINQRSLKQKNSFKYKMKRNIVKFVHKILPMDSPTNFKVSDTCTKCKICTNMCPRGNITLKKGSIVINKKCEYCLACVHNCPNKSIDVKGDKSPGIRYRNEHIKIIEIKKANNQIKE